MRETETERGREKLWPEALETFAADIGLNQMCEFIGSHFKGFKGFCLHNDKRVKITIIGSNLKCNSQV